MSSEDEAPSFVVDHMLGSLARWLRMLGYDAIYDKKLSDDEILAISKRDGRVILTRDRGLAERGGSAPMCTTDLDEQLSAVAERYSLTFGADRIRCSVCNGRLRGIGKEEAEGLVPAKSMETADEFWICGSCEKVYWNGTHWNGIMDRFVRLGLAGGGDR